jgi:hypothetical protein
MRSARRGQAAVMLALSIFALMLLLAMATNVGMLVNDRVRMQATVDLSTYAVAYSQAAALNDVSAANERIADVVKDCRQQLERGPIAGAWPATTCNCLPTSAIADQVIQMCKMRIDQAIMDFANSAQYDATVTPALAAGRATAEANFSGMDVTFFDDERGSPTARGTYRTYWRTNLGASATYDTIADFDQVTDVKLNYLVAVMCPPKCIPTPVGVPSWPDNVAAWFYKRTSDPDIWAAGRVSGTPSRPFLDVDYRSDRRDRGHFGASSTGGDDMLVAYAVAKPYDGAVGPTRASWAQRTAFFAPRGVFSNQAVWYPKLAMVQEYRARLAGIHDDLAGPVSPAELIEDDARRLPGRSWDMDKFLH